MEQHAGKWLDTFRSGAAVVYIAALAGFSSLALARGNAEFLFYGLVTIVLAGVVLALDRGVRLSHLAIGGLVVWAIMHLAGGTVAIGEDQVLYNWRPGEWLPKHDQSVHGSSLRARALRTVVEWLPKYDQAVHFFGFAVATLVAWECLAHAIERRTGQMPRATTGLVTGAALIGMGLGGMNEVVEFIATLTIPDTNVGGYENTGWDLVSNLTGCVAMALWIRAARQSSKLKAES